MPMYDPEISVSRPEKLPAKSCGLTIQNTVFSPSSGSASRVVSTVTSTLLKSGVTAIAFTVPNTTSLNFN